jgi:hypothetical protein
MKFVKSVVLVAVLMAVASLITGFWLLPEKYVSKSYAKRHPDFGKPDLGGIVMEGEFTRCNSDNLLKFEGYYKTLDTITLVFDASSPISGKMLKRYADTHYNANFQGVIYKSGLMHKYVTYQFEPFSYEKDGEVIHVDKAKVRSFRFPLSDTEPQSFYYLDIKGYRGNKGIKDELKEVDMVASKYTQTQEIEQSYWTDYMYDQILQYYNAETGKWTEKVLEDQMTNNMPLE